jgi:periplasmic copper chaperone A
VKRWHALVLLLSLAVPCAAIHADEPGKAAVQRGDPLVKDAWARATPPGAGVAAAYLTIVGGQRADRLVSASTAVAQMTQIHSVTEAAGMSRMRETDGGVVIAAGQTVVLAPHGLHLMLMNLQHPLVAGQSFEIELRFAVSGSRIVSVMVLSPDQPAPSAASAH